MGKGISDDGEGDFRRRGGGMQTMGTGIHRFSPLLVSSLAPVPGPSLVPGSVPETTVLNECHPPALVLFLWLRFRGFSFLIGFRGF